jgi:hypothetical protein
MAIGLFLQPNLGQLLVTHLWLLPAFLVFITPVRTLLTRTRRPIRPIGTILCEVKGLCITLARHWIDTVAS